ncbi:MAG: hypothetical protein QOJ91_2727 [Sphingomonadales bacterium]|jgi:SAM-dependent methyltransferase|nr:hypothetical protein [Sphingomonadales bacterium]
MVEEARPVATTNAARAWEEEYRRGGIPSSVRGAPSGSVVDFIGFARGRGITGGEAVDVGCGSGRNSIYLATSGFRVTAMDYVEAQTEALAACAAEGGLPIRAFHQDVREPWPVGTRSQRVGIDTFCFKHQISAWDIEAYVRNAALSIAEGGILMISFAGREDGYYSQFPIDAEGGPGQVIRDPGNGILSRLYRPEEVVALFPEFDDLSRLTKQGSNEMHGRPFDRQTHIVYLQRR